MIFTLNDIKRFEEKFYVTPGCWIWTAFKRKGYGRFRLYPLCLNANRVAYQLYVGPIPDGLLVCHKCDNPSCVNPKHLFLGTDKDNAHDMQKKGRKFISKGVVHGMAKLSEKQVREIREATGKQRDIAKRYGISQGMVGHIRHGRNWKHID